MSSTIRATLKSSRCSSILPASIFDRSRIELISSSRCLPAAFTFFRSGTRPSAPTSDRILLQHLAVADDGIERRAQLVRHVREERGLVLARDLELMEQPRVLHGQRGLAGKCGHQIDDLSRKLARLGAGDRQGAHHLVLANHRHRQHRSEAALDHEIAHTTVVGALDEDVRHLDGLPLQDRLTGDTFSLPEGIAPQSSAISCAYPLVARGRSSSVASS